MRRALTGLLAVVALTSSVIVAHASSFSVEAGHLQALTAEFPEFQPPQDPDTYAVTVHLFFYNGTSHIPGQNETKEVEVTQGGSYTLAWTGQSLDSSTCPSSPPTPPTSPMFEGLGTFTPAGSGAHILCLDGTRNWNAQTAKSDFLAVTVTEPETTQIQTDAEGVLGILESDEAEARRAEESATVEPETTPASDDVVRPDDVPSTLGENCVDGGWQYLTSADGYSYANEQACVDDQVQFYYDNLRGDGS